ncbi:nickel-dependent hydrogenase large subunit [Streptomyces sp. LX-29]|uniref:Ni/Fe hydrogenase subunit alpha n=1 Tax=Streptomyces sp. LX-29 TaxID=2900152 RepID=UPI00240D2019|nr:nickel-dependent hydrogenase large subunit [Streptomyces sp. LX-29]WFB05786.1 nickel-dependent hydrogenase large subunit [Streptomyces sp. LX-29]
MTHGGSRTVRVGALARVEGEGAVRLRIDDGTVTEARLRIYEPPRFFEAFLRGRRHTETPDLTSRVCGICPVAYQTSACQAIEDVCGITVDGPLAALRRLLYCGEWIESQTLHIHLLHAPDFLGCDSAVELARSHRDEVERGLRLKQAGNTVMEVLGGRAIHPINVRVGGFHHVPTPGELRPLAERLRQARDDALATVAWVAGFDFPDAECDADLFALAAPDTYAIEAGTPTVLPHGDGAGPRTFPLADFPARVVEEQVPHSTALQARLDGGRHLTGALARYAISGHLLPPAVREAATSAGLADPASGEICRNPFRSIVVRAVEVLYAVEEALRLIGSYERPPRPAVDVRPRPGTGHGASEAPRGTLYHRYTLDREGVVTDACLVPPTAQNQGAIEEDLRRVVQDRLERGEATDAELTRLCERAVRNHDPCISCSAHFLDLTVERRRRA